MTRTRPSCWLLIVALWIGAKFIVTAGYLLPPEMEHATPEQKRRYIQVQSELMLHQKLQAGEQRYEWRLALRLQILEQTRAAKEEREQEIVGNTSPPAEAAPEKSNSSSFALLATVLLIPGIGLIYRKRRNDSEGISFTSLVWEELKGSVAHISGQTPRKPREAAEVPVVLAQSPKPAPSPAGATPAGPPSHGGRFGRIRSMRVCLDLSPEAKEFISEARVLAQVHYVLELNQIRIEEKSPVWLTLSVAGEWDERRVTFTHREELALVESVILIRRGVDMQTAFVNLWGGGYTEFVKELEAEQRILGGVQQITEVFADAFMSQRESKQPSGAEASEAVRR